MVFINERYAHLYYNYYNHKSYDDDDDDDMHCVVCAKQLGWAVSESYGRQKKAAIINKERANLASLLHSTIICTFYNLSFLSVFALVFALSV